MPKLLPLNAVTFDTRAYPDLSSRIAPPYDVLDEEPKRALLAGDPVNIVAIDLPVTPPKTVGPDSAYSAAGQTFRSWLENGTLGRQGTAVFAYEQVFDNGRRRRGLFAGLEVDDCNQPNGIFRHENTIQGGIDDRYKLTTATGAQLSPVFGIFRDPRREVATLLSDCFDRDVDFHGITSNDHVEHRCWKLTDCDMIAELAAFFADKPVFIADGHHRYHTALRYCRDHPNCHAAKSCLFVLVAAEDDAMHVLPTHRVFSGMTDFTIEALGRHLAARDDLVLRGNATPRAEPTKLAATLPVQGHHAMGLCPWDSSRAFILTTPQPDPLADRLPRMSRARRELDVAILHDLLVDRVLRPHFGGQNISVKYTADLAEFDRLVNAGPGRLGVIMQPAKLEQVIAIALANEVMPPKSTFFYPKMATGLVMQLLE